MKLTLPRGVCLQDEQPGDINGIRQANRAAFGGEYEVIVIDRLRSNCPEILSLVAKDREKVIGHFLFSPEETLFYGGADTVRKTTASLNDFSTRVGIAIMVDGGKC